MQIHAYCSLPKIIVLQGRPGVSEVDFAGHAAYDSSLQHNTKTLRLVPDKKEIQYILQGTLGK